MLSCLAAHQHSCLEDISIQHLSLKLFFCLPSPNLALTSYFVLWLYKALGRQCAVEASGSNMASHRKRSSPKSTDDHKKT